MSQKYTKSTMTKTNEYKMPTNWWGRQNAAPIKFDSEPSETAFYGFFSEF